MSRGGSIPVSAKAPRKFDRKPDPFGLGEMGGKWAQDRGCRAAWPGSATMLNLERVAVEVGHPSRTFSA